MDEYLSTFGAGRTMFAGDWNNNGVDTLGQFRNSTSDFLLVDANDRIPADYVFGLGEIELPEPRGYGQPRLLPVAGELGSPPR